jgi:hypothetical protein
VIKLPSAVRGLTRRAIGMATATSISPGALRELSARESVVVIGVGIVRPGATDPRLPGSQRVASLLNLESVVGDLPKQQAIVLHCG